MLAFGLRSTSDDQPFPMSDKCSSHLFLSTGNCCVFFLGNFNFGSGGDVSGGVVGGGRGVASGGGGGPFPVTN